MVAIYCRISGKKAEGKDVSIEVQETSGIEFANRMNMPYKLFIDRGISGAKSEIEDRPAFSELFKDIKNKKVSAVYAYDQARIVRKSRIWHLFVYALEKSKCKYYEGGKEVNFDDLNTKLTTGIIALVDELYTETTSRKVKAANRANAEKGKGHGITAYGYKKDKDGYLVIDKEQAKYIKEIFDWSYGGIGTYTIAKKLNDAGVPTKSHQFKNGVIKKKDSYTKRIKTFHREKVPWRGNVIYDMITNPIYKGERHYGDVVTQIPNIVPPELWDQVNQNLKNNKKNVGPNNKFNYLLNGLIFCATCKAEFRGKYRASGRNKTYSCKGASQGLNCKTARGLNIPRFESFILNHLFHSKELYKRLSGLKIQEEKLDIYKSRLKKLKSELKHAETTKSHFYNLLSDPQLASDKTLKTDYLKSISKLESIEQEVVKVQTDLTALSSTQRQVRLDKIFREYDYKMNFDQIKKSVHAIIETIMVKHLPEQKYFVVQINYRGFDELSVFASDHEQMSWVNMTHYQVVPRTEEDKNDDEELFDYLAPTEGYTTDQLVGALKHIDAWKDEYEGWAYPELLDKVRENSHYEESVLNIDTPNVVLKKPELYDFNTPS